MVERNICLWSCGRLSTGGCSNSLRVFYFSQGHMEQIICAVCETEQQSRRLGELLSLPKVWYTLMFAHFHFTQGAKNWSVQTSLTHIAWIIIIEGSYPFSPFPMPSPNGVAKAFGNTPGSMEVDGKALEGKEKLPIKRSKESLGSLNMITGKNIEAGKSLGVSANGGYSKKYGNVHVFKIFTDLFYYFSLTTLYIGYRTEGSILVLQTCFDQLNIYTKDLKNMKLEPIFTSSFKYILDKPNFSIVLCESVRSTAVSKDLLENLCIALPLSPPEKIGMGLAFFRFRKS